MKLTPFLLAAWLGIVSAHAADSLSRPIAAKGALVFSDDFSAPELGKAWRVTYPTFTVADGALIASQTKPEHSAVGRVPVGLKDLVIEFKFRLGDAKSINAVCNDLEYKEGHGGHLCRVSLSPRQIFLGDDKERLRKEIEEMKKDPARKDEVKKLTAGREQSIPMPLHPTRWYALAIEIVGDEMRVSLDGQAVGLLKSSGLAHPTKREFYFAVSGTDARFDDMRIWSAKPAVAARAEAKPPDEATLRAAVTRGLSFVTRETDTWMDQKDCNGCHHMPELLWSQREARRRGFSLDEKQADEFAVWTGERAKNTKPGAEMLAFLRLAQPDKPQPELTKLIVAGQQADGSWKPAGQFATMQRRDTQEAAANSTRLFLLALAAHEADRSAAEAARKKAATFLQKSAAAKSVETLVVHALYAWRFGPAAEADARREEIIRLQHPDGGWSWMIADPQSDPLATGQVLYLLAQSPEPTFAPAVVRAQAWLLRTQRADGGWPIDFTRISKIDRSAPEKAKSFQDASDIYTYWGSAWATLGLLHGVPVALP